MSELEASSQHESDLKDSRISTLEQDLKSLSSEKATWVSRLQQVSQTSLSLRDQLAEKTKEADQLRQQLKEQEAANVALRAKLLSYRPLEAAEQLRSEFETSISRALAQGDDSTRESMEIFARTFQQAFASALSSAKPSSSGNE
jgi:chromosome segregation ATPase